jgi:Pup amidohydrolase
MRRILAGIETEYGILVEGRGAEDQIDDAMALVRSYPGERLSTWDYRYESPRSDLRGFQLDRLAVDPVDSQFDEGRRHGEPSDVRSDQILTNGARFYNDHGHPEYATPECFSSRELALHDRFGESIVLRAANAFSEQAGRQVKIYKNNTDFHGATYGTHESYLIPRSLAFDSLYNAVLPILIARPMLAGAGKAGSESGAWCDFQLSQRADFFTEAANAETLFRRPIFNTRDECHADPARWIRLHVIAGDANMMPACTSRKVGLVKLAIHLAEAGVAPVWKIANPVGAAQSISRDQTLEFRVELSGCSWTTGYEILESYFAAAESALDLGAEETELIAECRSLLGKLQEGVWEETRHDIDWAAKRHVLEGFLAEEGKSWKDGELRAFDLEYHNIDPEEGLFRALEEMGDVRWVPTTDETMRCSRGNREGTRARARGLAVAKFAREVQTACWRSITFKQDGRLIEVELHPDREYSDDIDSAGDVESFVNLLRGDK